MTLRVYYEDTDLGGVVYHSNYLNFCERARSELFFEKGLSPVMENGHFVVSKLDAEFKKAAKLGDVLEVKTRLVSMRKASFTLRQEIFKDAVLLFGMTIKLAYVTHDGAPQVIDAVTKSLLDELFC